MKKTHQRGLSSLGSNYENDPSDQIFSHCNTINDPMGKNKPQANPPNLLLAKEDPKRQGKTGIHKDSSNQGQQSSHSNSNNFYNTQGSASSNPSNVNQNGNSNPSSNKQSIAISTVTLSNMKVSRNKNKTFISGDQGSYKSSFAIKNQQARSLESGFDMFKTVSSKDSYNKSRPQPLKCVFNSKGVSDLIANTPTPLKIPYQTGTVEKIKIDIRSKLISTEENNSKGNMSHQNIKCNKRSFNSTSTNINNLSLHKPKNQRGGNVNVGYINSFGNQRNNPVLGHMANINLSISKNSILDSNSGNNLKKDGEIGHVNNINACFNTRTEVNESKELQASSGKQSINPNSTAKLIFQRVDQKLLKSKTITNRNSNVPSNNTTIINSNKTQNAPIPNSTQPNKLKYKQDEEPPKKNPKKSLISSMRDSFDTRLKEHLIDLPSAVERASPSNLLRLDNRESLNSSKVANPFSKARAGNTSTNSPGILKPSIAENCKAQKTLTKFNSNLNPSYIANIQQTMKQKFDKANKSKNKNLSMTEDKFESLKNTPEIFNSRFITQAIDSDYTAQAVQSSIPLKKDIVNKLPIRATINLNSSSKGEMPHSNPSSGINSGLNSNLASNVMSPQIAKKVNIKTSQTISTPPQQINDGFSLKVPTEPSSINFMNANASYNASSSKLSYNISSKNLNMLNPTCNTARVNVNKKCLQQRSNVHGSLNNNAISFGNYEPGEKPSVGAHINLSNLSINLVSQNTGNKKKLNLLNNSCSTYNSVKSKTFKEAKGKFQSSINNSSTQINQNKTDRANPIKGDKNREFLFPFNNPRKLFTPIIQLSPSNRPMTMAPQICKAYNPSKASKKASRLSSRVNMTDTNAVVNSMDNSKVNYKSVFSSSLSNISSTGASNHNTNRVHNQVSTTNYSSNKILNSKATLKRSLLQKDIDTAMNCELSDLKEVEEVSVVNNLNELNYLTNDMPAEDFQLTKSPRLNEREKAKDKATVNFRESEFHLGKVSKIIANNLEKRKLSNTRLEASKGKNMRDLQSSTTLKADYHAVSHSHCSSDKTIELDAGISDLNFPSLPVKMPQMTCKDDSLENLKPRVSRCKLSEVDNCDINEFSDMNEINSEGVDTNIPIKMTAKIGSYNFHCNDKTFISDNKNPPFSKNRISLSKQEPQILSSIGSPVSKRRPAIGLRQVLDPATPSNKRQFELINQYLALREVSALRVTCREFNRLFKFEFLNRVSKFALDFPYHAFLELKPNQRGHLQPQIRLRQAVWRQYFRISPLFRIQDPAKRQEVYDEFVHKPSHYQDEIVKDLGRTLPEDPSFQKGGPNSQKLRNILIAYSNYNPNIGYAQGLNFIVAFSLFLFEDEVFDLTSIIGINNKHATLRLDYISYLIDCNCPDLTSYLSTVYLTPEFLTTHWLFTLFAGAVQRQVLFKIWDLFLLLGWGFLNLFIVAILVEYKERIYKINPSNLSIQMREVIKSQDFEGRLEEIVYKAVKMLDASSTESDILVASNSSGFRRLI